MPHQESPPSYESRHFDAVRNSSPSKVIARSLLAHFYQLHRSFQYKTYILYPVTKTGFCTLLAKSDLSRKVRAEKEQCLPGAGTMTLQNKNRRDKNRRAKMAQ